MADRPRVALLLLDRSVLYDAASALQVFGHRGGPRRPPARYDLAVCGPRRGTYQTSAGLGLRVDHGLEAVGEAELVIVPGFAPREAPQAPVLRALQSAHRRGARVMSICTGAFALAYAGLLDGRRATTHWAHCAELRDRFPSVRVEPDVLYVDEGDILTSAGIAAGMDLCLHVVRKDFGAQAAIELARWNLVPPHRDGGQAQFIETPVPESHDGGLAATRAWALEHLHEPIDVAALARHAHQSERTFARRFKAETGTTPKRWLLDQRVQHARRLLESTDLPIETIARRAGFGSAALLRLHFQRATATRPTDYRRAFRVA